MQKIIYILLIVFICSSCSDTESLVKEIENVVLMESEYIGISGEKSEQYKTFLELKSKASNNELRSLLNHNNPIVKTFAYQALIDKKQITPSKAFKNAMQKNENFRQMNGDQIIQTDICTEIYFYTQNRNQKSDDQIEQMDIMILYDLDENHFLHYMALNDKKHEERFNSRIRELALEFNNVNAILYLLDNNVTVDINQLMISVKSIIENGKIGNKPKKRLQELLIKHSN